MNQRGYPMKKDTSFFIPPMKKDTSFFIPPHEKRGVPFFYFLWIGELV